MSLFYREKEMPLAATEILGPPTSVPFKSLLPESSSFCTLFHLDAPNMLWNVKLTVAKTDCTGNSYAEEPNVLSSEWRS